MAPELGARERERARARVQSKCGEHNPPLTPSPLMLDDSLGPTAHPTALGKLWGWAAPSPPAASPVGVTCPGQAPENQHREGRGRQGGMPMQMNTTMIMMMMMIIYIQYIDMCMYI